MITLIALNIGRDETRYEDVAKSVIVPAGRGALSHKSE